MLKYVDTKVTFSEVPDEISLCINISNCPHRCRECHSPYLQEDTGTHLTKKVLKELIVNNFGITCVCFMGGDNDIPELVMFAKYIKDNFKLHTAWYSGLYWKPTCDRMSSKYFDYIKVGPYIKEFGPLNSPKTNQRMYAKVSTTPHTFCDITYKFWKDDTDSEKERMETESK